MNAGELERRPPSDRENAVALGEEFGLGALEQVSRDRDFPRYAAWSGLAGVFIAIVGLPTVAGVSGGPYSPSTKVIVAAVFGGLFLICCLALVSGIVRSAPRHRLFRYSGGLAQLLHGEPEPRVARWSDVGEFTVTYFESDETAARLDGFSLRTGTGMGTSTGTSLPGLRAYRHKAELRAVVAEACRVLTPRLVPAMTEAIESGRPVAFGRVRVTGEGIVVSGAPPKEDLAAWREIKSIHIAYLDGTDYAHEIIIGRTGKPTKEIRVSGLPNGLFLPHVLSYVASRHGVLVTGYREAKRGATESSGTE